MEGVNHSNFSCGGVHLQTKYTYRTEPSLCVFGGVRSLISAIKATSPMKYKQISLESKALSIFS